MLKAVIEVFGKDELEISERLEKAIKQSKGGTHTKDQFHDTAMEDATNRVINEYKKAQAEMMDEIAEVLKGSL